MKILEVGTKVSPEKEFTYDGVIFSVSDTGIIVAISSVEYGIQWDDKTSRSFHACDGAGEKYKCYFVPQEYIQIDDPIYRELNG